MVFIGMRKKGGENLKQDHIYIILILLREVGSEESKWLKENGYINGNHVSYNTKKADEFINSFEESYIKMIEEYIRNSGSISWTELQEIVNIEHTAFVIFVSRLVNLHEILVENPDHIYTLNQQKQL
jgi:hypothetical protein